jgi:hypothetical protein
MHATHGVGKHPRQRRHHQVTSCARVGTAALGCPGERQLAGFSCATSRRYTKPNAADAALSLELHPWPPDCPLAQSASSMAHRDLHRRQNDPDRIPRILDVSVDGANQPVALLEVDSGDGSLRSPRSKERVGTAAPGCPAGRSPATLSIVGINGRQQQQTKPRRAGARPDSRGGCPYLRFSSPHHHIHFAALARAQ